MKELRAMMTTYRTPAFAAIAASVLCGPCLADPCTDLWSAKLSDTTITAAEFIAAGLYTTKGGYTGRGVTADLPAHCRVAGFTHPTPDSHINFEIWLPASGWSDRYIQVGNGGLGGQIIDPEMATALSAGAATASTDDGNTNTGIGGFDADWAIGHPEKVIDYGYRAVHLTAVLAHVLVKTYYGTKPKHDYFVGCSDGGRESLMEAQRYPEDFEGYLVGAPGINIFASFVSHIYSGQALAALGPEHQLTMGQLKAVSARVIQQCDALDGVRDGILRDPRVCHFDPHNMICTGVQSGDQCLTAAQADAIQKVYDGPTDAKTGARLVWGANGTLGVEDRNWVPYIVGPTASVSPIGSVMARALGSLVYGDPTHDVTADLAQTARDASEKLGPIINPDNTDLAHARALGRKILMFHGWADSAITPQASVEYFEAVQKRMGDVSGFYRLFMVPGMQHCSGAPNTGADFVGPDSFGTPVGRLSDASNNWHLALERWVEEGKAPDKIVATEFDLPPSAHGGEPIPPTAKVKSTRPLCSYPKVAVYKGRGDVNDAASFSCR